MFFYCHFFSRPICCQLPAVELNEQSAPQFPPHSCCEQDPKCGDWAWGLEQGKGKDIHLGGHAFYSLPRPDQGQTSVEGLFRDRLSVSSKKLQGHMRRKAKLFRLNEILNIALEPGNRFANSGKIVCLSDGETIYILG